MIRSLPVIILSLASFWLLTLRLLDIQPENEAHQTITLRIDSSYLVGATSDTINNTPLSLSMGVAFSVAYSDDQLVQNALASRGVICSYVQHQLICVIPLTPDILDRLIHTLISIKQPALIVNADSGALTVNIEISKFPRGIGKAEKVCDDTKLALPSFPPFSPRIFALVPDGNSFRTTLAACVSPQWRDSLYCVKDPKDPKEPKDSRSKGLILPQNSPDPSHLCFDGFKLQASSGEVVSVDGYSFAEAPAASITTQQRQSLLNRACIPTAIARRPACLHSIQPSTVSTEIVRAARIADDSENTIDVDDDTLIPMDDVFGLQLMGSIRVPVNVTDGKIVYIRTRLRPFRRQICTTLSDNEPILCEHPPKCGASDLAQRTLSFLFRDDNTQYHCDASRHAVYCNSWSPDISEQNKNHKKEVFDQATFRVLTSKLQSQFELVRDVSAGGNITLANPWMVFVIKDDSDQQMEARPIYSVICRPVDKDRQHRTCTTYRIDFGVDHPTDRKLPRGKVEPISFGNQWDIAGPSLEILSLIGRIGEIPNAPTLITLRGECRV